jgi:hypothetical protein
MRWLFLLLGIVAKADQTEWVRELETGIVPDPDNYMHIGKKLTVYARGAYGLSKDAWSEVSNEPWGKAHDRDTARRACAAYLELTYIRLKAKLGRELTFADVYCGYRYGVNGYVKMGARPWCTPVRFQEKLIKYHVPYQRLTNFR